MRLIWVGFVLVFTLQVQAQEDLKRCKKIANSSVVKSNQIIVLESVRLQNSTSLFKVTSLSSTSFKIELDSLSKDSVEVCYTVLPSVFSKTYLTDSTRYYDSTALFVSKEPNLSNTQFSGKRQEFFKFRY